MAKRYSTKSVIIGRKKGTSDDPDVRPCFISLFDANDPHKKGIVPFEILEFEKVHKVEIDGLDVNYLLPGNDIVINDLEFIEVKIDGPHVSVNGKQGKH